MCRYMCTNTAHPAKCTHIQTCTYTFLIGFPHRSTGKRTWIPFHRVLQTHIQTNTQIADYVYYVLSSTRATIWHALLNVSCAPCVSPLSHIYLCVTSSTQHSIVYISIVPCLHILQTPALEWVNREASRHRKSVAAHRSFGRVFG